MEPTQPLLDPTARPAAPRWRTLKLVFLAVTLAPLLWLVLVVPTAAITSYFLSIRGIEGYLVVFTPLPFVAIILWLVIRSPPARLFGQLDRLGPRRRRLARAHVRRHHWLHPGDPGRASQSRARPVADVRRRER